MEGRKDYSNINSKREPVECLALALRVQQNLFFWLDFGIRRGYELAWDGH
jgi:hypothetical protein